MSPKKQQAAVTADAHAHAGESLTEARLFAPEPTPARNLFDRFLVPPFTVLDTRQGYWQDRKRQWVSLGLHSELGRGEKVKGLDWDRAYHEPPRPGQVREARRAEVKGGRKAQDRRSMLTKVPDIPEWLDGWGTARMAVGTSIFDPVLAEALYRWHTVEGGTILDPFAGGSVRGLVAAALRRTYVGIDLNAEQVKADQAQDETWRAQGLYEDEHQPTWHVGDAADLLPDLGEEWADYLIACPPYWNLEVYSDDPADLSTMGWDAFCQAYRSIIAQAVACLKPDRFATFVVSPVREQTPLGQYRDLPGETVRAFQDAGCHFYNDAALINTSGTLALRVARMFVASRKMGRSHQQVLTFVKGDPWKATEQMAEADLGVIADLLGEEEA